MALLSFLNLSKYKVSKYTRDEHDVQEELDIMKLESLIDAAMPNINMEKWLEPIRKATSAYAIEGERLCMFLAQIGHESNDLNSIVENLNYSESALNALFGNRITKSQARQFGRTEDHKADQKAIANIIYGGKWGERNLGNIDVNDGWEYRGRGAKQITGRYNYGQCGKALKLPLVEQPELLEQPEYAVLSAAWYFETNTTGVDIVSVTRQINGGTNGLSDRAKRYERVLDVYHKSN